MQPISGRQENMPELDFELPDYFVIINTGWSDKPTEKFITWDDQGGPMCSGYPYHTTFARARRYETEDAANKALDGIDRNRERNYYVIPIKSRIGTDGKN